MGIAGIVAGVARAMPDRPAVTAGGQTLSYGAFWDRARRIAGGFRARGLLPGDRVLLCMENRGAVLEAMFACWIAGLCAVPANARLHPREVAYISENCGARLLVTTAGLHADLAGLAGEVEALDAVLCAEDPDDWGALLAADPAPLYPAAPEEDAWLFYTSGTTGRPKGARLSHRSLLFMAHCYYADIDFLDETDTKLHAAPLSHASGIYALPHMFRGGHQVVLPGFEPGAILDALRHYRNVTLFGAPTMVTRLVHSPEVAAADTRNLKTLYYGGGPMYVADLERALAIFGPKLYQLYGQGESPMTITGLSKRLHGESAHPRFRERLASCGVARTGVAFRVVDEAGRDLPPGEVGEVVTRSDCVMSGYWRNPEATAAALRDGWLWTGDLGSVDAEGFLTLRDRSKDMIISGGSNIYPREIEEVLLRDPAVLECSIVGRPHPEWGEEVVAFLVAAPGARPDIAALERRCLDSIARYKRPRAWRVVPALPKNNYGKVLKTELRRLLAEEEER